MTTNLLFQSLSSSSSIMADPRRDHHHYSVHIFLCISNQWVCLLYHITTPLSTHIHTEYPPPDRRSGSRFQAGREAPWQPPPFCVQRTCACTPCCGRARQGRARWWWCIRRRTTGPMDSPRVLLQTHRVICTAVLWRTDTDEDDDDLQLLDLPDHNPLLHTASRSSESACLRGRTTLRPKTGCTPWCCSRQPS